MTKQESINKVNDIIKTSGECVFSTIDPDGYPHAAVRSFCKPGDITGGYISTNTSGNLAQSVMKSQKASMCIHTSEDNITLLGTAKIVNDKKIKEEMWLDWFSNHYPNGVDDPEYCVIEFNTEKVSLWVDKEVVKFDL